MLAMFAEPRSAHDGGGIWYKVLGVLVQTDNKQAHEIYDDTLFLVVRPDGRSTWLHQEWIVFGVPPE